tara:strand:+ start:1487 stop:1951 length:465 start_codon:yes stop_codon:yes gene_type:complete
MALNQFTTQSAWINGYSQLIANIDFKGSTADKKIELLGMNYNSVYNFDTSGSSGNGLAPEMDGFYFINVSLSTKGSSNDFLKFWVSFSGSASKTRLVWEQKGGNAWSTNYNTIIPVFSGSYSNTNNFSFYVQSTALSSQVLQITHFNVSIIKIY